MSVNLQIQIKVALFHVKKTLIEIYLYIIYVIACLCKRIVYPAMISHPGAKIRLESDVLLKSLQKYFARKYFLNSMLHRLTTMLNIMFDALL